MDVKSLSDRSMEIEEDPFEPDPSFNRSFGFQGQIQSSSQKADLQRSFALDNDNKKSSSFNDGPSEISPFAISGGPDQKRRPKTAQIAIIEDKGNDQSNGMLLETPSANLLKFDEFLHSIKNCYKSIYKNDICEPSDITAPVTETKNLVLKTGILTLERHFEGNLREEFAGILIGASSPFEFLKQFLSQKFSVALKCLEDSHVTITFFLCSAKGNIQLCDYKGAIFPTTVDAISLLLLRKLNPVFIDWLESHSVWAKSLKELWLDADMIFITDHTMTSRAVVGFDAALPLTEETLNRMITETAQQREEIVFHHSFMSKVFELEEGELDLSKSLEENVRRIFKSVFKMDVHFISTSSKNQSSIMLHEGSSILISYISKTKTNVVEMKESLIRVIFKFILKSKTIDQLANAQPIARPTEGLSALPIKTFRDFPTSLSKIKSKSPANSKRKASFPEQKSLENSTKNIRGPKKSADHPFSFFAPEIKAALEKLMVAKKNPDFNSLPDILNLLKGFEGVDLTPFNFTFIQSQKDKLFEVEPLNYVLTALMKITLLPRLAENRVRNVHFMNIKHGDLYNIRVWFSLFPFKEEQQTFLIETDSEAKTLFESKVEFLRKIYPKKKNLNKIVRHLLDLINKELYKGLNGNSGLLQRNEEGQGKKQEVLEKAIEFTFQNIEPIKKLQGRISRSFKGPVIALDE